MMEFEWDENKNQMNIEDHEISFEEAKPVFVDDYSLDFEDTSASEVRYNKIGMAYGLILFVVYTIREAEGIFKIRIISARKANNYEKRSYLRNYS